MAARRKYPPVPEQVRVRLEALRERGVSFDEAWEIVVGGAKTARPGRQGDAVQLPHFTEDRRGWREALAATRDEWRTAYEREQSALSVALAQIEVDDRSGFAAPRGSGAMREVVAPPTKITRQPGVADLEQDAVMRSLFSRPATSASVAA